MSLLTTTPPAEAGFDPQRWDRLLHLAAGMAGGDLPALALQVSHRGRTPGSHAWGRQHPDHPQPVLREDAVFLTASITKPIVAMASLLLVERGLLSLNERVNEFFPGTDVSRKPMTVRHLLTHTSGLPDMLPDNRELRMRQAPLGDFIAGSVSASLDFPPGRGVQYQSMGFVLLSDIIEQVSGQPISQFLRCEIFEPCGMTDTELGPSDAWFEGYEPRSSRIPWIQVPSEQEGGDDWNWNSRYWRQLGAPWGGLLSTTTDLLRFLQVMQNGGRTENGRLFAQATVEAAVANQLHVYADVPESDRRCRGWGFGWRLQWPAHPASYGDLLSPSTYGHWGATGTLFWVDPQRELAAVLLTTQPLDRSGPVLARLSNAIVGALM
jgi:CubicO group peptidase (beta-lactamase class C family)